jgi:diketogulonate reductase-like aldo/keto reductase
MSTTVKLASGREMPLVGFGLWKVPAETAAETVYNVSKRPSIDHLEDFAMLTHLP